MAAPKRRYSRAFTPHGNARRWTFTIDRIPAPLWKAVREKAKRDGVSLRALVLEWLQEWADRG